MLGLDETRLTDAGLMHLEGLANIEHLYLFKNHVTEAGVDELQK